MENICSECENEDSENCEYCISDAKAEMAMIAFPNLRPVMWGTFPHGEWSMICVTEEFDKVGLYATDDQYYTVWEDGRVTRKGNFVTI